MVLRQVNQPNRSVGVNNSWLLANKYQKFDSNIDINKIADNYVKGAFYEMNRLKNGKYRLVPVENYHKKNAKPLWNKMIGPFDSKFLGWKFVHEFLPLYKKGHTLTLKWLISCGPVPKGYKLTDMSSFKWMIR